MFDAIDSGVLAVSNILYQPWLYICLSAKGINGVMKMEFTPSALSPYVLSCYSFLVRPAHYRTRGGEWRGCIAATPYGYMVSVVRKGINKWRKPVARKLISSEIDSISPDGQSLPVLRLPTGGNVYVQNFPL